jgi:hypothetical protein
MTPSCCIMPIDPILEKFPFWNITDTDCQDLHFYHSFHPCTKSTNNPNTVREPTG